MERSNDSPTKHPTLDQQRDALQKGLGRAWQWADSGQLSVDLLFDACLNDWRYDRQCEQNRGPWLWELMHAQGCIDRFRQPILEKLSQVEDEGIAAQLCDLIYRYAIEGDAECRDRLGMFVRNGSVAEAPWVGVEYLLWLDGSEAFEMIARTRGEALQQRDWQWHDTAVVDKAVDVIGDIPIRSFFAGSSDPHVIRFAEAWQIEQKKEPFPHQADQEARYAWSPQEVVLWAEALESCGWLRDWGFKANSGDLEQVAEAIRRCDNPEVIERLLLIFCRRDLPSFADHLMQLCTHPTLNVRRRAFQALANLRSAEVRRFALEQLEQGDKALAIDLFKSNFEPGDEKRILQAIELPENDFHRHGILIDILYVLKENVAAADVADLGLIIYFHTPCSFCRESAVRLLLGQNAAPAWLLEEARFDAIEEILDQDEEDE
ncbi:HEAT repeat domain-containing protein [Blastopirellula marina]|uniref:HEAT repeat domain-containing protein n=1 Tax=Blastopirellula marina TaxID=124 RepID=A0A2S8F6S5_9BACT|nr:HEAT repeat domain-containing protein [Blastopirellula marina]PQO27853.1 hypothetical protein C5Y98_26350 [Blastopirellula marina]PTL41588.1 HEAT repeat domain-containing protein [Blastopirellula marina]